MILEQFSFVLAALGDCVSEARHHIFASAAPALGAVFLVFLPEGKGFEGLFGICSVDGDGDC